MNPAFAPLSVEETASRADPQPKVSKVPIIPVPDDAPPCSFRHPIYGEPTDKWPYQDAKGKLLGYAARFDFSQNGEPKKEFLPLTYCKVEKGGQTYRAWRACGIPPPRPLYRLPQLSASLNKPVILTEGEKKADRAAQLFPEYASTTTMSGAESPHKSDFHPLARRRVIVWPDNDEPGQGFAAAVAQLALQTGALEVRIVNIPSYFPPKWDLADEPPPDITHDDLCRLLAEATSVAPDDEESVVKMPSGFEFSERGLIWTDPTDEKEILVAGNFQVVAETRDGDGTSWGVLLHWQDHDRRDHELALPRGLLAGDGADARRVLLDGGLYVAPGRKPRELLNTLLLSVRSPCRARATNRIGWHGDVFVLPNVSFGNQGNDRPILQGTSAAESAFKTRGTLDDWNRDVAQYGLGNSRLTFAISAAFAAPLVEPCSAESGGFHLRGPSSIGKTILLTVAGSVCGGGDPGGYVQSWRATANGLEGVALTRCDTLLCLDEMAQISAKDAGEAAYMLANESGKNWANRDGGARRPPRWHSLFLSSGEIGLADKIAEDGRGKRSTAGQQVRVVDLPADAGKGLGVFEELHGFPSAEAFARQLRTSAKTTYGTALRAFLHAVAADRDNVRAAVADHVRSFVKEHVPVGADGQVERVAQRFALVAAAGELAVTAGVVTHWEAGEATSAAARCFKDWLAARGGAEPTEVRDGIAQVRAFVSAHGEARFVRAWDEADEKNRIPTREVAGYRKQTEEGWDYYVTPEAWREEVCRGFDPKALAVVMVKCGLMEGGTDSRLTKSIRLPGRGKRRLYHIRSRLLEDE